MTRAKLRRYRIGMALGILSTALLALTLAVPDWIERWLAIEPDGGDGSLEWGWVIALGAAALICFGDALRTRRDAR